MTLVNEEHRLAAADMACPCQEGKVVVGVHPVPLAQWRPRFANGSCHFNCDGITARLVRCFQRPIQRFLKAAPREIGEHHVQLQ